LPEGCRIWKAHRVRDDDDALPALDGADRLLLDAYVRGRPGGTGSRFDWGRLSTDPHREAIVLSGGINPSNVVEADLLGCWGLDLSSGVERRPGEKDLDLIEELFAARRNGALAGPSTT
jgi:phosphoribosylanthranilate isomerase